MKELKTLELKLPGAIIALGAEPDEFAISLPAEKHPERDLAMLDFADALRKSYGLNAEEGDKLLVKVHQFVMEMNLEMYLKKHLKVVRMV